MYFLVNASPPGLLDVATSNFADALVRSEKRVFAMVYHRLLAHQSYRLTVRYYDRLMSVMFH